MVLVLTGCGTGGSSTTTPPPPVRLVSIAVTPASVSIQVNGTQQFAATGTYSDASTLNLTSQVAWASSSTSIATVNGSGLATAVASGSVTISATLSSVVGSRAMTVTAIPTLTSISVTPALPTVVVNTTAQLQATGTWSDGSAQDISSQVAWAAADGSVATIDNAGLATAVAPGSTDVSATLGTVSGSTTLTVNPAALVSIVITPDQTSVPAGISQSFAALGIFNNGSTQQLVSVNWGSSDSTVVSIDNTGAAATLKAGSVTISATSGSVTGSTTLTVLPAALVSISFSPASPSLAFGTSIQITAVGLFTDGSTQNLGGVVWTSSDPAIATIDVNGNLATVGLGSVTITATLGSISNTVSASVTPAVLASIAVTPANPSIAAGLVQQFTATGTFTDSTTQDLTSTVTWSSSAGNIATVDSSGLASGLATGNTTITALFGSVSGGTGLIVTQAQLQSVTVTPQNLSLSNGTAVQLTATGHYSDGTTADISSLAAWTSTDNTIASVDNTGLVTGRQAGTVTITATLNGISNATTLTVIDQTVQSIVVTPVNPTVSAGNKLQFSATAYFTDGTSQVLTAAAHWSTSSARIATINSGQNGGGLATAKAAGTATITATFNGVSGSTTLTVN